ncbi:MAG: hypothetical protein AB8G05_18765 [Oligoflexales bacterium]
MVKMFAVFYFIFVSSTTFGTCLKNGEYELNYFSASVTYNAELSIDERPKIEITGKDKFNNIHKFIVDNSWLTLNRKDGGGMAWNKWPLLYVEGHELFVNAEDPPYGLSNQDFPKKIGSIDENNNLTFTPNFQLEISLDVDNDTILKRTSMLLHPATILYPILGMGYFPFYKPCYYYKAMIVDSSAGIYLHENVNQQPNWCVPLF